MHSWLSRSFASSCFLRILCYYMSTPKFVIWHLIGNSFFGNNFAISQWDLGWNNRDAVLFMFIQFLFSSFILRGKFRVAFQLWSLGACWKALLSYKVYRCSTCNWRWRFSERHGDHASWSSCFPVFKCTSKIFC